MATKEPKQPAGPVPAIEVTALRDGFRRAGRAWPAAPTVVALAEFSAEQIAAIEAEPQLVSRRTELPAAAG